MQSNKKMPITLAIGFCSILVSSGLIVACATAPQPYEGHQQNGSWEAKAQAKDLVSNKSYAISLEFIAMAPGSLRLDVTGTLGVNLATLVIQQDEIQYMLYRQKKYYEGVASDRALSPLFKMALNPKLLNNVCMDLPINEPGWSCEINNQGFVDSCQRKTDNFKIVWSERSGDRKRVTLTDKAFELQILFKSFSAADPTKVQGGKSPFQIEPPKDFARYKIP